MKCPKFLIIFILSSIVTILSALAMIKLEPVKRPFLCNDPKLSLPARQSTITGTVLFGWTLLAPLIIILICEFLSDRSETKSIGEKLSINWKKLSYLYRFYIINFAMQSVFVTVAKVTTGSHRPHFFETCQPDKLINCTANSYVFDFTCTKTKISEFYLRDSSMSFFSGHAMYMTYSCFFLIFYLHYRLRSRKFTFLLTFLQSLLISFAFFGSISRLFDNRHHVVDITIGAAIGILSSIHVWFIHCKNFEFNNVKDNGEKYDIQYRDEEIMPVNSSSSN
ncbi:hypothetical protein PVAND_009829 [Polypedilum vanderplanki]|uniref:Phosphatidic acid phosphatase type 2/haloperoxidase domain-containing protein n=1 Tax=Polypedilum vanderplanki TaxID=319348 RepID=A0A9J6CEF7_POLVA|nr:hypothetical protein PVAND_009829 [Polypedilum vanderplanki]